MAELDREALGRMVRDEWIRWAREQPDPKPSWLVPWDDLPEPDREMDRRIGQRLYDQALEQMRAHADDESLNPEALWRQVDRQWSARYRADVRSRDQAIAEAVADERQRIEAAILGRHRLERRQTGSKTHGGGPEYRDVCVECGGIFGCRLRADLARAAGSVPVADSPAQHEHHYAAHGGYCIEPGCDADGWTPEYRRKWQREQNQVIR